MFETLLQTKLFIPAPRPNLVARAHLLAQFDVQRKLTLVHAPAGFGKTTLTVDWLAQVGQGANCWLSLDQNDNDPARFLGYLTAAFQTVSEQIGSRVPTLLRSLQVAGQGSPSPEAILTVLINDLAAWGQPIVLVLDDYHLLTETAVHDLVRFLLDHMPPLLHLVILSRTEPPLQLPRLRVRGELTELDSHDLRFSAAETAVFLNDIMQLNLAPDDVARLEKRTEGWAASLQLAAVSLQKQAQPRDFVAKFSGDDRYVVDYLLGEVLAQQTPDLRDFLLQTAVLNQFTAELCAYVTQQPNSPQLLAELEQNNLFILPLDNRRRWYRYHPLFAEFLQGQLSEAERATNHHRASLWFAEQGIIEVAVEHALMASDHTLAANLIDDIASDVIWEQGRLATMARWLDNLSEPLRTTHPGVAVGEAWLLYATSQFDALEPQLVRLQNSIATYPNANAAKREHWQGQLYIMSAELAIFRRELNEAEQRFASAQQLLAPTDLFGRGLAAQGEGYLARLKGDTERAEQLLTAASDIFRQTGNVAARSFALCDLAETHLMAGRLQTAVSLYETMRDKVNQPTSQDKHLHAASNSPQTNPALCGVYVGLGNILREQNRLDEAIPHLERALALTQNGYTGFRRLAYWRLAETLQAQGNHQGAAKALRQARQTAERMATPWVQAQANMMEARLALLRGESEPLVAWAAAMEAERPFIPIYQRHQERVVLARYGVVAGVETAVWATIISQLLTLLEEAKAKGWQQSRIEILLLLARARQNQGQQAAAQAYLREALQLAAPEGYIRLFVDEGATMATMLRQVVNDPKLSSYVGQLQAAFMPTAVITQPLLDPLTKRELEVLKHMSAGLSNPEIAQEMIVATGTVAKYSSNIFAKLHVRNRTEATTKAQDLGLI
ncbi:MAG: LuxR C-terminal-related transcriptional regulator [Chloroflexota bacterium]